MSPNFIYFARFLLIVSPQYLYMQHLQTAGPSGQQYLQPFLHYKVGTTQCEWITIKVTPEETSGNNFQFSKEEYISEKHSTTWTRTAKHSTQPN